MYVSIIDTCPLPALHGVSAFGIKLCFYSLTKEGLIVISPEYIHPPSPQYLTDTAPIERWNYDVLAPEGEAELHRIVQFIITECGQLPL